MTNRRRADRVGKAWVALLLAILFGGGLGTAAWFLLPPRYESHAGLLVHNQVPAIFQQERAVREGAVDSQTAKNNTMALLKTSIIAQKALDDPAVRDLPILKKQGIDAAEWLADALQVDNPSGGEVIRVSLANEDREGLDRIVNAVVRAFISEVVEKERSEMLGRRDNLNKKFLLYKNNLMNRKRELFDLSQHMGTSDAQTAKAATRIATDDLEDLMRTRAQIQKDIGEAMMKIELLTRMVGLAKENASISEDEMDDMIAHDPNVIQATKDLAGLKRQLRESEGSTPPAADSALKRIRDDISNVQEQLDDMRAADRQALVLKAIRAADKNSSETKALQVQVSVLKKQRDAVTDSIRKQAENVQSLERFNGDAEQAREDIEEFRGIVHEMGVVLDHWNIELDADSRVEEREPATVPRLIEPLRQPIGAAAGALAGFFLVLVTALFVHLLRR